MEGVIFVFSVFKKLPFRGPNYLFHFRRKNHHQTKLGKFVFKPVTKSKEKELLHQQLLVSLQECKTVEEQIKVFHSLVKLPSENIDQRYAICTDLETSLRPYFPLCSVRLVGSSVNDLGFKGCDVDLSIQLPEENVHKSDAKNMSLDEESTEVKNPINKVFSSKNQLLTIRKILQGLKYEEPLTVIPGRCPILSFTARNLPCDLSVNNRSALNGTKLMLLCGKLDKRIVPLTQIIIYWAKKSKLVGGHSKFKTYSVFLMVVYFLQTRTPPILPSVETMLEKTEFLNNPENWSCNVKLYLDKFEKSKNNQTIEQLLKEFFLFYGNFDFSYIICPINGIAMDRKSFATHFNCIDKFELNTICIQDPFNLEWNVTTPVHWNTCKSFLKALIPVWEKCQDKQFWTPSPQHWGLTSLISSEFSYKNLKDIKELCIDLSLPESKGDSSIETNSINIFQKASDYLYHILTHCLLFQCHTFNDATDVKLLQFPSKVKTSITNLLFKNDIFISSSSNSMNNCKDNSDTKIIAQYICATQDTWSGRNTFLTFADTSENIFDIEHKVSEKMIAERGVNEKELFYFLCQCFHVSLNDKICLRVRLKPLNNDIFIPKLAVFLKEYIPYVMDKFYKEPQDKY